MGKFLVLVLALALAGGAATIVRAADRSPTPVVAEGRRHPALDCRKHRAQIN
jgi:hypothetical protein